MKRIFPHRLHRSIFSILVFIIASGCRGQARPIDVTSPVLPTPTSPPLHATLPPAPTLFPSATSLPEITPPVVWYVRGTAPGDLAQVNEKLNQKLAERGLHARIEIRPVEWSGFARRMADLIAAGEAWDMVSLSGADYLDWVQKGRLLPLSVYPNPQTGQVENLLAGGAPNIWTSLPPPGRPSTGRAGFTQFLTRGYGPLRAGYRSVRTWCARWACNPRSNRFIPLRI
jgi:hypothetical protein